ncbi:MAG TPA: hypothetical protein VFG84_06325 [Gemmatimonadaceae bacterium]|nr:hypothetical protein [Gemmatimonadaceae bacterium]
MTSRRSTALAIAPLRALRAPLLIVIVAALVACGGGDSRAPDSSAAINMDSSSAADLDLPASTTLPAPEALDLPPAPDSNVAPLSPLADSISGLLVFEPITQRWFVAAARAERLLLDIGRVDTEVRRDSARARAYRRAVAARSPFQVGMQLRIRSATGAEPATIAGFDTWNGRIVATLRGAPRAAALAASTDPMTASAERIEGGGADASSAGAACARDTVPLPPAPPPRVAAIRDSVLRVLEAQGAPPYPRLVPTIRTRTTWLRGCFGDGDVVMAVTRWAGANEWVQEEVLLVAPSGAPRRLVVNDLRFRSHELLDAFDADGDGTDDVAARAQAELVGGTVILRLVDGQRLERLAAGFAWESR